LDLWARPPAKVAARHLRRTRFAPLRKFGASEQLVDRLTDGDALGVVTDLTEKAKRGDPSAANILADLGHTLCPLASPKMQEAQSLPGNDAEWLNAALQEKIAFNNQFWAACQSIDQKEVDGWVAKLAEQGNGASLWLSSFGSSPSVFKQKLVAAVEVGYPDAQEDMALDVVLEMHCCSLRRSSGHYFSQHRSDFSVDDDIRPAVHVDRLAIDNGEGGAVRLCDQR
jgi:hypothetical protein